MDTLPRHLGGHNNITHTDRGALKWLFGRGGRTLLDVGCGPGGQVELAREEGFDAWGIDGDPSCEPEYVHDYTKGSLDTILPRIDVVWCIEFLEHLEIKYLPNLWPTFHLAQMLVLTASPPGHGGHHHVNEQPLCYWIHMLSPGFVYSPDLSLELTKASTMTREFIRNTGMVFLNKAALKAQSQYDPWTLWPILHGNGGGNLSES